MLTKDKKPFTYTPGGIDLSQIRSPRMQRRITRNACADEMPGIPAPTTNQHVPVESVGNTNFSAMQSQLPSQVLPPIVGGAAPPPPPPPPPPLGTPTTPAPVSGPTQVPAASSTLPKTSGGRPSLGFDPNELLARVNKSPAYEPVNNYREEPQQNFKSQPVEEKPSFEPKHQSKPNEIGQNIYVPLQNEPRQVYAPQMTSKAQSEPERSYTSNQTPRSQVGSIYVPPVVTNQVRKGKNSV